MSAMLEPGMLYSRELPSSAHKTTCNRRPDGAFRPGPLPPTPEPYVSSQGLFRVPASAVFAGELSQFYGLDLKEQDISLLEEKANKGEKAGIMGSPTNSGSQMRLFSVIRLHVFLGPGQEGPPCTSQEQETHARPEDRMGARGSGSRCLALGGTCSSPPPGQGI